MITEIEINNYKSINELKLPLGRINVFIGENGAGKSNVLEVIALAAAAAAEKLDHEFLSSRGIRVTRPEFMRPAFPDADPSAPIKITTRTEGEHDVSYLLNNDNTPYSKWTASISSSKFDLDIPALEKVFASYFNIEDPDERARRTAGAKHFTSWLEVGLEKISHTKKPRKSRESRESREIVHSLELTPEDSSYQIIELIAKASIRNSDPATELSSFVIYSPENSALRMFDREGQIEPLGINGEGLLKLLSFYASKPGDETLIRLKKSLRLLDWFDNFETQSLQSDAPLLISDRYLAKDLTGFDHRGTNEGFFFLLFYFLLFNSELTPKFFAIDNIDASLNPKLCEKLMRELSQLAKQNNKQAIFTTHNPAILDGLNLDDDEQRLFVISRGRDGTTKVKRIKKPDPIDGKSAPRLSELFIRGLIGGLPKGF